jgi:cell division protein FtsB
MNKSQETPFDVMHLGLVIGFFVVAYMLYNLTVSIYENYQIEEHIVEFEKRNQALAEENKQKLEDLQYYISEEYIDKVAKQNLNLINPGEKVIVIPDENLIVLSEDEDTAILSEQIRSAWSTPKKWWKFFFSTNPYKS